MARFFDQQADQPAGDVLEEACGITGLYVRNADVARLAYFGLYALQHRGQESAGISVGDGEHLRVHREMGLIGGIFNESILGDMHGFTAVGHTRYSTTGGSVVYNAQPFLIECDAGQFTFAHNGNVTNAGDLAARFAADTTFAATSDSEILAKTIALAPGSMTEKIRYAMSIAEGAYSVVMQTADTIYAFRDPWGVRP